MKRDRLRLVGTRVAGVVAVLGLAAAVTLAAVATPTAKAMDFLAKYSPSRLVAGRVWTLPTSAFLLGHPRMLGSTSVMIALVFLPYALWRGIGHAGITAMSGHLVATLVIAAVVLPGSLLGWATATSIAHMTDYGPSAALAACAGGLAVLIGRRAPVAGVLLLVIVAGYFTSTLLSVHTLGSNVADIEHLVALFTGVAVEWGLAGRKLRPQPAAGTPETTVAGLLV